MRGKGAPAGTEDRAGAPPSPSAPCEPAHSPDAPGNRGNKLAGTDNPGARRARLWSRLHCTSAPLEPDFPAVEGEFLRRAKGRPAGENLFDALLAGFRQHASLFAQEGISLKGLFAFEDLLERPLSPRMRRALRNRHLSVLSTLLMLQIEKEQAQYRRLMHLAELLCIEEYRLAVPAGAATDSKLPPALQGEIDRILSLQRRPPCASLCSPEELVQLQALCHEYLHAKRQYISLLRKIRAGAVYALFQANFMLRRLDRMSRHLLRARQHACDANTLDQDAIETNTDS